MLPILLHLVHRRGLSVLYANRQVLLIVLHVNPSLQRTLLR